MVKSILHIDLVVFVGSVVNKQKEVSSMSYTKCPKCGRVGLLRDKLYTRKRDKAKCKAIVCHQLGCGYRKLISVEHTLPIVLERSGQYSYQF